AHRAVMGKSSGGYGAMVTALWRPDLFGALATHAGDALWEVCYLPFFPSLVRSLRDDYGGSFDPVWADFRSRVPLSKESDGELVEMYAYAAAYSADGDGTVRLPFDTAPASLVPAGGERWLPCGPVRI